MPDSGVVVVPRNTVTAVQVDSGDDKHNIVTFPARRSQAPAECNASSRRHRLIHHNIRYLRLLTPALAFIFERGLRFLHISHIDDKLNWTTPIAHGNSRQSREVTHARHSHGTRQSRATSPVASTPYPPPTTPPHPHLSTCRRHGSSANTGQVHW